MTQYEHDIQQIAYNVVFEKKESLGRRTKDVANDLIKDINRVDKYFQNNNLCYYDPYNGKVYDPTHNSQDRLDLAKLVAEDSLEYKHLDYATAFNQPRLSELGLPSSISSPFSTTTINGKSVLYDSEAEEAKYAEQMFKKEHNRDAVAETGKRIYEREKSELKDQIDHSMPGTVGMIKNMADNGNKAAQDYINNYNECVEFNNNNSLSDGQLNAFNEAFFASRLNENFSNALDDYKNKLALQNNNINNNINNNFLVGKENTNSISNNQIELKGDDGIDFTDNN